jgi:predicted porin
MKKVLLAASVAAAMAMPAAHAGVTIYGKIHASVDFTDVSLDGAIYGHGFVTGAFPPATEAPWRYSTSLGSEDMWSVNSRSSRIGFKGTEDLGNGLSVIWKAETGYDIADGGAWGGARNAYIGLAGDWGTFLYGIHDTPYKMSTGSLDPFADTAADFNAPTDFGMFTTNIFSFQDVRAENAIAYISPNMNGLTFAAAIVPGEGAVSAEVFIPGWCDGDSGVALCADISPETHDGLADAYSVAAMYENNGLFLSAAYESLPTHSTSWSAFGGSSFSLPIGQQDKYRLGAGYTMNNLTINGVYEHRVRDFGDVSFWAYDQELEAESDIWQVSAVYTFGNNALKVAYGQGDMSMGIGENFGSPESFSGWFGNDGTFDSIGAELYGEQSVVSVGLEHNFSKRTKVYALYTMQEADLGIKAGAEGYTDTYAEDFDVGVGAELSAENSTFSMGMVHTF